jgi:hypothetical protein
MDHQDVEKRVGFFPRRSRQDRRFIIGTHGLTELCEKDVKPFIDK